jgi:hypothetical protein
MESKSFSYFNFKSGRENKQGSNPKFKEALMGFVFMGISCQILLR